MRSSKYAIGVAAISGALLLAAVPAGAQQTANLTSCVDMASQVKTALASNSNAANYEQAAKQQGYGRDYCTNGFYKNGVAHYAEALRLLGVGKS